MVVLAQKQKKKQILGTNKFVIYFYNGKDLRNKRKARPEHFLYKQWGRIFLVDENGKRIGTGYPFQNYGEMLNYINRIMEKSLRKNIL